MTARWYRSRLFWSGLTGLVMLVSSWFLFARTRATIGWLGTDSAYSAIKDSACIGLSYWNLRHRILRGATGLKPGFHAGKSEGDPFPFDEFFEPAFRYRDQGYQKEIRIGIWFIVAFYTATWLGGMIWWQRRKRRLMHHSLPPPPAGTRADVPPANTFP